MCLFSKGEAGIVSFEDGFPSSCALRAAVFSPWTALIPDFATSGSQTSIQGFVWILEVTSLKDFYTVKGKDESFQQE